jgi:rRNA maturation RNase YbeY
MYISTDTVYTNSLKFRSSYDEELLRVIIHGVLHLCGLNDKGPGERAVMETAENKALDMWNKKQF